MTLSCLKTKLNRIFVFFLISSHVCSAMAKDADSAFMKHCMESDAYLKYFYTDVTYKKSWDSYERSTSVQSKMAVNSRAGVEEYAFLNLSKSTGMYFKSILIRTLKADGTVVKLDSSLVLKHIKNEKQAEMINYPIPGVEPGDTIEIKYTTNEFLEDYELGDFVNLYSPVPSLNTEYSISTSSDLQINYKTYNNFPQPLVFASDTLVFCLFKMEEIEGLKENQYTCMLCELPYIYYSIDKKGSVSQRTWKEVYNQEFNFVTQPIMIDYENTSYYNRWKKRVIGEAVDSSKYYKLGLLMHDIYANYKIQNIDASELIKSSGYFLKEMHFDPLSIRRLYRQILEDLEIKYWAVFARSKRSGNIDPYYIRKGEYDHIFFAYENEQGSIYFLYPHDVGYNYQMNELPTSLYNAHAVIARPAISGKIKSADKYINADLKLAEVDSLSIEVIKLPGLGVNYNYAKQVFFCEIDPVHKNASFTSSFSVSGGLSTDLRSFINTLNQNKEAGEFYQALAEYEDENTSLKIDSVTRMDLKSTKPFVFTISGMGKLEKNITFINDSLLSLSLNDLILHSQVQSEADSSGLNYYLDYCYADHWQIIFKFPNDIVLVGSENKTREFKNDFGAYVFNMNVMSNNQLIIQSNYKVLKDTILKDEYDQIKNINAFIQEIKNMRILLKMKNATS